MLVNILKCGTFLQTVDEYKTFAELAGNEKENSDFRPSEEMRATLMEKSDITNKQVSLFDGS